jgi:hypothetical protein
MIVSRILRNHICAEPWGIESRLTQSTGSKRGMLSYVAVLFAALLISGCNDPENNPTAAPSPTSQSPDYVIQNTLISTVRTFEGARSLTIGPSVVITSTGNATLTTVGSVYFKPGVVILRGGRLRIVQ